MWQGSASDQLYSSFSGSDDGQQGIPPGFDISVGTLYEKDNAANYLKNHAGFREEVIGRTNFVPPKPS